jgi:DNA polymerase-1
MNQSSRHALPKIILRRGRKPAGAILGFANMLLRLYRDEQPRAVLVAWDTLEVASYRHENFPAYQSEREFDDALLEQLDVLPEFVAACGFQNAKAPGFEGMISRRRGGRKTRRHRPHCERRPRYVPACLGPRHHPLSHPRRRDGADRSCGSSRVIWVDPRQVLDFIALRGDPSDKLPGALRVGATGAATLLQDTAASKPRSLPAAFPAQAESLRLYRSIATMDRRAPLPSLRSQKPTWRKAAALAGEWDLNQLADRFEEFATG